MDDYVCMSLYAYPTDWVMDFNGMPIRQESFYAKNVWESRSLYIYIYIFSVVVSSEIFYAQLYDIKYSYLTQMIFWGTPRGVVVNVLVRPAKSVKLYHLGYFFCMYVPNLSTTDSMWYKVNFWAE